MFVDFVSESLAAVSDASMSYCAAASNTPERCRL